MHLRPHATALAAIIGAAGLVFAGGASATTTTIYQALAQSRTNRAAPNEVYLASFNSLDDVFSSTTSAPTGFTQIDVSADFQIVGFTHDPGGYRILVESRGNTGAPNEVYLATFATLDDLFTSSTGAPTNFTSLDVAADFQIVGFTYDPGGYRILVESRSNSAAPNEV